MFQSFDSAATPEQGPPRLAALRAVLAAEGEWLKALTLGALFGLFCDGTYDLSNMAVLRDWPLQVTAVDIAWGVVVSAVGASAGAWALRWTNG